MLDLIIRNGFVVDGTGAPGFGGDVGIRDGRVVAVGQVDEPAARQIDADGLVVAPGFVDLHTHYDAQLSWDPWATPSPLHGTTTVIGGNCGFTVAPTGSDGDNDYLTRLLARVEGMPLNALQEGLAWDWQTFGQWLDRLDGTLGVNAGFLVGHSTIRRVVMGEAANGGTATPEQLAAMVAELDAALAVGALGFSTSQSKTHNDGTGSPVPSRSANREELLAFSRAVAARPGTTLEIILTGCLGEFSDDEVELMTEMSLAGNRPINWNVLTITAERPQSTRHQLDASSRAAERGAVIAALTLPNLIHMWFTFANGFALEGIPGWPSMFALPPAERIAALSDPAERRRLRRGATSPEAGILTDVAQWHAWEVAETFSAANAGLVDRKIGDIAAERGGDPFDVLLDIVVADELKTGFRPPPAGGDDDEGWRQRAEAWTDPRTVLGGSDAGAHLDVMCGAVFTTQLLADGVRRRQLVSVEEAVHQLSDVPARLYGLRDRGRIAEGWHADLVLFDPTTVDAGPIHKRHDLPAGAPRLYSEAVGVEHVLVHGTPIVSGGSLTEERPGSLIRSGRDTDTVSVPGGS